MIYSDLSADKTRHKNTPGECAKCSKPVHESQFTLDDCYNVWAGKCPHCGAINLLDTKHGRGYMSSKMFLVLPTEEEKRMNDMPADCPTRESELHK